MFPTRIAISDKAPQELFEHKNIEWVKQGAGPTLIQERVDLVAVDDESPVTQITQNSQLSGFFFGIPRISAFVLLEELSGKVKLSSLTASVLSTISHPCLFPNQADWRIGVRDRLEPIGLCPVPTVRCAD